MTAYFRVADGVSFRNEQPQMARLEAAVIRAFFVRALACILTSAYRPPGSTTSGENTLHDEGLARDYDTDRELSLEMWVDIRDEVQEGVGKEYQILAHDTGSGMHLHGEYDPPWRN